MKFAKWLDTFISEKGIDTEHVMAVEGKFGTNYIPVGCLIEAMKETSTKEQRAIKTMAVKIDFLNGDVMDYFKFIAKAIAI